MSEKGELKVIASTENRDFGEDHSAVSLVFAAGARPDACAIRALAKASSKFAVSFNPAEVDGTEPDWIELLANGLTFDATGLSPGPAQSQPERVHLFGLADEPDFSACEAITITPGAHLAGGRIIVPVLRALAEIGARLAELPQLRAIVWHPARSWSEPAYFRTAVMHWLEGGPFPGLGLTAIAPTSEGALLSEGLALFTGQELLLGSELARDRAEGTKVALRLINWLADNGRITESTSIMGPSGETLHLVPEQDQRIVKVTAPS